MYNRVSRELRDKIAKDIQETTEVRDEELYDVVFMTFTSEEENLRQECIKWRETINLYFLSSYTGGALKKFLNFNYLRPREITKFMVKFEYEYNYNLTWRDWFIVDEGKDYASIITA